jgi:hypothetical protein
MTSEITYKNAKDKKIDFIYTHNNKFTIIIRDNNLFIIIKNQNNTPYISKWKLQYNDNILLIESNDLYNKNLSQDHINILINSEQDSISRNKINIMTNQYSYKPRSIIDKTIKIINTTFYSKNKIQLGGYDNKLKLINKSLLVKLVKLSILNRISHIDNLILSNIQNYIEDDYLDLLKSNNEKI